MDTFCPSDKKCLLKTIHNFVLKPPKKPYTFEMNDIKHLLYKLSQQPYARLVIQVEHAWIVLSSFSPASRILFEIASNVHLPKENHLTEEQLQTLNSWGYTKRRKSNTIGTIVYLSNDSDIQRIQQDIKRIFTEIFLLSSTEYQLSFQMDVKHDLSNSKLHSIMKKIAIDKQHSNRITLYQTLLNSQLLVYMTEDKTSFHPYDTIGTFLTYAAFTDDKYIKQLDPRGCPVQIWYAYQFIPELLQKNAGSLILNPKGDVRGELYRNELQSIAKALRHHKS